MADNKAAEFIQFPSFLTVGFKNFLISTARNAFELYGDDQAQNVGHIYAALKQQKGGKWVVVMCPKD